MSLLKKGLSDSKYYLLANLGNKALALLIIPILAKSVGVEEFATYDLFLLISTFLNIFIILGIDSGIAILLSESKDDKKQLSFFYGVSLIVSAFALFIIALVINFLFLYFDKLFLLPQSIWNAIFLYSFFMMITYHTFNFLRWQEQAKEASFVTLFSYLLGMLIGVSFLYFQTDINTYLKGLIIGVAVGACVALYIARDYLREFQYDRSKKEKIFELFKLSLPFVPNYLGNSLMQMADRIVIVILFGKYELGVYALITKLAMIPQIILGTLTGGFLPVMYSNYKSKKGKELIKNFFHAYLLIIPLAFIVAYFCKDLAVALFGGEKYIEYAYLLPMALVAILFVRTTQANGFGYSIQRKTHYIMYITFLTVVLNYIFSFAFASFIGLEGVIIGTLFAGIIRTYLHTYYSEKLYRFGYSFIFITFIASITLALLFYTLKEIG